MVFEDRKVRLRNFLSLRSLAVFSSYRASTRADLDGFYLPLFGHWEGILVVLLHAVEALEVSKLDHLNFWLFCWVLVIKIFDIRGLNELFNMLAQRYLVVRQK